MYNGVFVWLALENGSCMNFHPHSDIVTTCGLQARERKKTEHKLAKPQWSNTFAA